MADQHFSRDILERFIRSELSREENRDFVRHLLRQCPQCSGLLREMSQREDFRVLIRGLSAAAFRSDPESGQRNLAKVAQFPARSARASP